MKEEFLNYIGPPDSLHGYVRSYKLVFYKCFFDLLGNDNAVPVYDLTEDFQLYYMERKNQGLKPDADVDSVIENIEFSSLESVYKLILRNPYHAIHNHNFIDITSHDGTDCFSLNKELYSELTSLDIDYIKSIVDDKISLYFSRIDNAPEPSGTPLRDMIIKLMTEYVPARQQPYSKHPLANYIRQEIPKILFDTGLIDPDIYKITGSAGLSYWSCIPCVAIFDKSVMTTAQKGKYICYLLSEDRNSLYLTFMQGTTEAQENTKDKKGMNTALREEASKIVNTIDSRGFKTDENIHLGDDESAKDYEHGTIFYKEYTAGEVPPESELRQDLINMLAIYEDYVASLDEPDDDTVTNISEPETGGDEPLSVKEIIELIKAYIAARGFSYEDGLIENFYLSLKSKPFVILAGTSGTGKTRLVRLFAEAVGATTANGRFKMVSVRPDWSDSSDLFGHVDLNGDFIPGAIIDFVKTASSDLNNPYFLCLDEMNLARVEYYLSDILSVIETREMSPDGKITTDPLIPETYYGADKSAVELYGTISLPENLYIIGTVNMDETTFPFSRKVLDRANTIEFSYVDLMPDMDEILSESPKTVTVDNSFLKTNYLLLSQCKEEEESVLEYCSALKEINEVLYKASAHVGYRVRDEIVFYLLNNKKCDLLDENSAFDYEIMQKILPRIQGSSSSTKDLLCELFKICAGDYDGYNTASDDISSKMLKALDSSTCKYRRSAEKIAFMMRRFEEDGFTSYWL